MDEYDKKYPEYEFKKHKGYPTKKHIENMYKYGILDIYRTTYKPVKDYLESKKMSEKK
jgi:ribonuclease HII